MLRALQDKRCKVVVNATSFCFYHITAVIASEQTVAVTRGFFYIKFKSRPFLYCARNILIVSV